MGKHYGNQHLLQQSWRPREPSKVRHFVPLGFQLHIGCSSLVKDSSLVKNSPFTKTWTNWTSFNCTDLGLSENWFRSAITSRITGATDSNRQFGTGWQHQSRILEQRQALEPGSGKTMHRMGNCSKGKGISGWTQYTTQIQCWLQKAIKLPKAQF